VIRGTKLGFIPLHIATTAVSVLIPDTSIINKRLKHTMYQQYNLPLNQYIPVKITSKPACPTFSIACASILNSSRTPSLDLTALSKEEKVKIPEQRTITDDTATAPARRRGAGRRWAHKPHSDRLSGLFSVHSVHVQVVRHLMGVTAAIKSSKAVT
jgi:hypothetical protein